MLPNSHCEKDTQKKEWVLWSGAVAQRSGLILTHTEVRVRNIDRITLDVTLRLE